MATPKLSLRSFYLILYNTLSAAGWLVVLFRLGAGMVKSEENISITQGCTPLVSILTLTSILETLHILVGIVRGGLMQTVMQFSGKSICLFLCICKLPSVQMTWAPKLLYTIWSISESIRYLYYAAKEANKLPNQLHYLRYTAFIVLYPLGFIAEIACFLLAYQPAKALDRYSIPGLPQGTQFFILTLYFGYAYTVGAPSLYMYMLKTRKKQLYTKPLSPRHSPRKSKRY